MKKLLLLLAAVAPSANAPPTTPTPIRAQADKKIRKKADKVPNQYIVVLEDWAAAPVGDASFAPEVARDMASIAGGRVKHVYKHALQGFSIEMSEEAAERLAADPRVK